MQMLRLAVATCLLAGRPALGQGNQWPSWVPSAARDMFGEIDDIGAQSKAAMFNEEACDTRTKLMKALGPVTGPEKGQIMMQIISEIGFCELKNGKFNQAMRRFQSAISELNAPSEDQLKENMQFAPVLLMRDACQFLNKQAASRAAVELRRTRTVYVREKAKMLKNVAKQNKVPPEQIDVFVSNVLEKSKAGGQEAQQVKQLVKMINTFDAMIETVEGALNNVQEQVVGDDAGKQKKKRLVSGFVPGVLMEEVIEAENLAVAEGLAEKAEAIAKEVKEASLTSTAKLIKRSKDGSDCAKLPETCAVAKALPDLATNGFGETRVIVLKKGKNQALDLCDTNANVLVLLPLDNGVSVQVGEQADKKHELTAQTAVVVDHCLPLSLHAADGASVLAAQVWHPEIATIERTTEVRERAKAKWGLKEDEVKTLTASINAYGKKGWEAALKKWMGGPCVGRLETKLDEKETAAREAKNKAIKEAEEKAMNEDEDRKKALEELERKREEKKAKAAAIEKKRLEAKKRMDEERAKKDPWLMDPVVVEAEQKLDALKEERRDANAKLEFDLTKSLTQEINAQERLIAKTIKKARKAWKQGKTLAGDKPAGGEKETGASAGDSSDDTSGKLAAAEKKLEELKAKKKKAAEDEDYKKATALKKDQELLEKEISALRAKSEL